MSDLVPVGATRSNHELSAPVDHGQGVLSCRCAQRGVQLLGEGVPGRVVRPRLSLLRAGEPDRGVRVRWTPQGVPVC
jgi:hypothetical protein